MMANLFAFRATNPVDLLDQSDPVGPDNDRWLEEFSGTCAEMVVCWGVFGGHRDRANHVTSLLGLKRGLSCMGYSKIGFPRHPLYLPYTSQLEEYPPRGSQQNGHPDAKNSPSPC